VDVVTAFIFGENLRPMFIDVLVMFQYFGHELFRTILSLIFFYYQSVVKVCRIWCHCHGFLCARYRI